MNFDNIHPNKDPLYTNECDCIRFEDESTIWYLCLNINYVMDRR